VGATVSTYTPKAGEEYAPSGFLGLGGLLPTLPTEAQSRAYVTAKGGAKESVFDMLGGGVESVKSSVGGVGSALTFGLSEYIYKPTPIEKVGAIPSTSYESTATSPTTYSGGNQTITALGTWIDTNRGKIDRTNVAAVEEFNIKVGTYEAMQKQNPIIATTTTTKTTTTTGGKEYYASEWDKFVEGSGRFGRWLTGETLAKQEAYKETIKNEPGLIGEAKRGVYYIGTEAINKPAALAPAAIQGAAFVFGGEVIGGATLAVSQGTGLTAKAAQIALTPTAQTVIKGGVAAGFAGLYGWGVTEGLTASAEKTKENVYRSVPTLAAMYAGGGGFNELPRTVADIALNMDRRMGTPMDNARANLGGGGNRFAKEQVGEPTTKVKYPSASEAGERLYSAMLTKWGGIGETSMGVPSGTERFAKATLPHEPIVTSRFAEESRVLERAGLERAATRNIGATGVHGMQPTSAEARMQTWDYSPTSPLTEVYTPTTIEKPSTKLGGVGVRRSAVYEFEKQSALSRETPSEKRVRALGISEELQLKTELKEGKPTAREKRQERQRVSEMERAKEKEALWQYKRSGLAGLETTPIGKYGKSPKNINKLLGGEGGGGETITPGGRLTFEGGGSSRLHGLSQEDIRMQPTSLKPSRESIRRAKLYEEESLYESRAVPPGMERPKGESDVSGIQSSGERNAPIEITNIRSRQELWQELATAMKTRAEVLSTQKQESLSITTPIQSMKSIQEQSAKSIQEKAYDRMLMGRQTQKELTRQTQKKETRVTAIPRQGTWVEPITRTTTTTTPRTTKITTTVPVITPTHIDEPIITPKPPITIIPKIPSFPSFAGGPGSETRRQRSKKFTKTMAVGEGVGWINVFGPPKPQPRKRKR